VATPIFTGRFVVLHNSLFHRMSNPSCSLLMISLVDSFLKKLYTNAQECPRSCDELLRNQLLFCFKKTLLNSTSFVFPFTADNSSHYPKSLKCFAMVDVVIPRSEIAGTKPPYVCPGCFIHTYNNNMINRFHV
jgi:hypothetical protein